MDSMLLIIKKLKSECHRDSMKKNYHGVWKQFCTFFMKLHIKPESWEQRILLFAGYLVSQEKRTGTVRSYVSAIKTTLKLEGIEINENEFLLSTLTKVCRLRNDQWIAKIPIQKGMLKILIRSVNNYFTELNQEYLRVLYVAIMSTCYYGLFRIGELTTGAHVVAVSDVFIGTNKNKLMFIL